MMRLKVEQLGPGLHPSEVVVGVPTKDGIEEIMLDKRSVSNSTIPVGWPVGRQGKHLLVELPRQTVSGSWRVWVDLDSLIEEQEKVRA